jgi:methyl-branched lipid omega-hydroxylase
LVDDLGEAWVTVNIEEIDLSAWDFWTQTPAERDAVFAVLRRELVLPFYAEPSLEGQDWIEAGPGYWAVLRHADVDLVSHHPEIYSSAAGATNIFDLPVEFLEYFGSMINMDAPRHLRLRKLVARAFSPRMVAQIERDIATVAHTVVDDLVASGPGDFVTKVAARVPLEVICKMMGIPEDRYDDVFRCSNMILGAQDPEYLAEGADIAAALLGAGAELTALLTGLAEQRRAVPTDDLVTALALGEVDGERLTDQEIGSFFILLVVAGNETTRNAISSGLVALTENPDQRARWQNDFDAMAPTAVDEVVRWATPVTWMRRTATREAELAGHTIKTGDKLLLFYASANRDETVFTDPDRFDVGRGPNPHLAFGGAGPHFCLGAHLARREITEVYRELFTRVPDIRTSGEPQRLMSSFINGIKHVPCEFTVA